MMKMQIAVLLVIVLHLELNSEVPVVVKMAILKYLIKQFVNTAMIHGKNYFYNKRINS